MFAGAGKYRGATHAKCNINYFCNRYLPVVFHNLKGYDSHFIIRKAYDIAKRMGHPKISAIPNSYEKFMSFEIGSLKFIDSFQFMASSLENLVDNLYEKGTGNKYKNFDNQVMNDFMYTPIRKQNTKMIRAPMDVPPECQKSDRPTRIPRKER